MSKNSFPQIIVIVNDYKYMTGVPRSLKNFKSTSQRQEIHDNCRNKQKVRHCNLQSSEQLNICGTENLVLIPTGNKEHKLQTSLIHMTGKTGSPTRFLGLSDTMHQRIRF